MWGRLFKKLDNGLDISQRWIQAGIAFFGGGALIAWLSGVLAGGNAFIRMLAPWSYLFTTLVVWLLAILIVWAGLSASRAIVGWPVKPKPKPKPKVFPEARFSDVRLYIVFSAWGKSRDPDERDADINRAVLDRLADGTLTAHGRLESYEVALQPIDGRFWSTGRLFIAQGFARSQKTGGYGYVDLHTDWPTVKRLWPR